MPIRKACKREFGHTGEVKGKVRRFGGALEQSRVDTLAYKMKRLAKYGYSILE